MSVVFAILVVLGFASLIVWLQLPSRARDVMHRARESAAVIRDRSMNDENKERALRQQSIHLFGLFAVLAGGGILALLVPLGSIAVLDWIGIASLAEVVAVLERPDFLLGTLLVGLSAYSLVRRLRRP